jgi:hypothetical protein
MSLWNITLWDDTIQVFIVTTLTLDTKISEPELRYRERIKEGERLRSTTRLERRFGSGSMLYAAGSDALIKRWDMCINVGG